MTTEGIDCKLYLQDNMKTRDQQGQNGPVIKHGNAYHKSLLIELMYVALHSTNCRHKDNISFFPLQANRIF